MKLNDIEKAAFENYSLKKDLTSRDIRLKDLRSGIEDIVESKKAREAINSATEFYEKVKKYDFKSLIAELVKSHGCSIKPAPTKKNDADFVDVGKTGVMVRPVTGNLSDVTGRNYSGKDSDHMVGIVATKTRNDFLGTHSMGPCYPFIVFMKSPTGKKEASLHHANGYDNIRLREIVKKKDDGYKIESVIVGKHVARSYASTVAALTAHHFCEQLNIPFGIFDFEDEGKGSFWIDIDVQKKQIQVGNDHFRSGREIPDPSLGFSD